MASRDQGDTQRCSGREGRFEGSRAMIPAATATAPNDISTLIVSNPVSRLASAWGRSASCVVRSALWFQMWPYFSPLRGHSDLTATRSIFREEERLFGYIPRDCSYNMVNRCLGTGVSGTQVPR